MLPNPAQMALSSGNSEPNRLYAKHFKRMLDVVLVLLAAPAILPVVGVFALLIRRDGGPAVFAQERLGYGGRPFRMYKLRTMVDNAETHLQAYLASDPAMRREWDRMQKLRNDPRVTRIGSFLRTTSIDELPQLWNVLRGDMSIVGPRPMMSCQKDIYPGSAYYLLRPGLTGFWQVSSRNNSSFVARARFDAAYISRVSFRTDVWVILATIRVVLRRTGH